MGNEVSNTNLHRWAKSIAKAIDDPKVIGGEEMMSIFVNIVKEKAEALDGKNPNQKTLTIARVNG